ncbi:hypothetical protein P3T23_009072 [Paraburkholderia sp. GAS448]
MNRSPEEPVLQYNLGVALEEYGGVRRALAAYHACTSLELYRPLQWPV